MSVQPSTESLRLQPLLAWALEAMAAAVFITDREGRIVWINEAFARLSGFTREEAIGQSPRFLKSGRQDACFYQALWQTILAGQVWRGEVVERNKDGELYTVDETITPLLDEGGAVRFFVAVQNDITRRKEEGERDRYLAYHDPLTGLPNRTVFFSVLEQAVAHARQIQRPFGLLYIDLDNFKPVNDRFGHALGDQLLIMVARRLTSSVREEDFVARLGGDEFVVIETDLPRARLAGLLARKLIRIIARPFLLEGLRLAINASIGISIYWPDDQVPEELLHHADQAMYLAKNCGPGHYRFYEPNYLLD